MNKKLKDIINDAKCFCSTSDNYSEVQEESEIIDKLLGLNYNNIEEELIAAAQRDFPAGNYKTWGPNIYAGNQTWVGLSIKQLQTTYAEFYELLSSLSQLFTAAPRVIDFGAAYGRLGLVLPYFFDTYSFVGYEIVQARVDEGNRIYGEYEITQSRLECRNILTTDYSIEKCDIIFCYDIGELENSKRLLDKIEDYADRGNSFYLVARGRGVNGIIRKYHPWLMEAFLSHFGAYTVFKHHC